MLPETVKIGYTKKRVKAYVPAPMTCYKCQAYGHKSERCQAAEKCPRCGGKHSFSACLNQEKPECPHCHGNHSAGFRDCPKQKQKRATLKVKIKYGLNYAEAVKKRVALEVADLQEGVAGQTEPAAVVGGGGRGVSSKPAAGDRRGVTGDVAGSSRPTTVERGAGQALQSMQ